MAESLQDKPPVKNEDALENVFSLLDLNDRKNCRNVCKSWRNASYRSSLLKAEEANIFSYHVLVEDYQEDTPFFASFGHANMLLRICPTEMSYPVNHHELNLTAEAFWFQRGMKLKSVDITIRRSHLFCLVPILASCPNLEIMNERVVVKRKRDKLLPALEWDKKPTPLRSLLKFGVTGECLCVADFIISVIKQAPLLKVFVFRCDSINCLQTLLHRPISRIFVAPSFCLEELSIECIALDSTFLLAIINYFGKNLKKLTYASHHFISKNLLGKIGEKCPKLDLLMIGVLRCQRPPKINPFTTMFNLTTLSLFKSEFVTDQTLAYIKCLSNLTHLSIADCGFVTDCGINNLLGGTDRRDRFTELRLINLPISDDAIKNIMPNLLFLHILNLSYCWNITSKSIKVITRHSKYLRCLLIHDCNGIGTPNIPTLELPLEINKLIYLEHFGMRRVGLLHKGCLSVLALPNLLVLDGDDGCVDPFDYAGMRIRCPNLTYICGFNLKTRIEITSKSAIHRKRITILKCYWSPLNPCSFFRNEDYWPLR